MYNLVGKFKKYFFFFLNLLSVCAYAQTESKHFINKENLYWNEYSSYVKKLKNEDYQNGLSYIISGTLALTGGIWGDSISNDSIEKGIYTIFQSIGIASIGYGAFKWKVDGEERIIYESLNSTSDFSSKEKTIFLRSYYKQKKANYRNERVIKAITHGLIAGLNFYNANKQEQKNVKSALVFIGGVNLLATASYTFDF